MKKEELERLQDSLKDSKRIIQLLEEAHQKKSGEYQDQINELEVTINQYRVLNDMLRSYLVTLLRECETINERKVIEIENTLEQISSFPLLYQQY